MGICFGTHANEHRKHEKHCHWKAVPACSEDHNYEYSTNVEGEKEGEGEFKCHVCSATTQAREGRYHCQQCNIDVCKKCYETPGEVKPEDLKTSAIPGKIL